MLDQAFDALKKYNWGVDPKVLSPIDEAIITSHGDDQARGQLENRLADVLKTDAPRDAKDYVCRKLMVIGTASSVPTLAALLPKKDHSHMARYALERIPAEEAGEALRESLADVDDDLKVGVMSSIGTRGEDASVDVLAEYLGSDNPSVATAAAYALGAIRTPSAAKALENNKPSDPKAQLAATDASFACAEALLADGKKLEALAIYKGLAGGKQPKHVRLAATRGVLACAGKSE